MTTHDYPGDVHSPAQAEASVPPETATDPGGQRQADQFAADRGDEGLNDTPRSDDRPQSDDQSSMDDSLFGGADLQGFRREWDSVQAGFVDDPKHCVEQADGLVSAVVEQLSSGFTAARSRLEQQWSRGEDASTEDLRVALKRYREFFDRLLAV